MLTRLKLLRLQREMMETREKKMLEMREKKGTMFISANMLKGNEATLKGRKARHQEGYSGNNSLN